MGTTKATDSPKNPPTCALRLLLFNFQSPCHNVGNSVDKDIPGRAIIAGVGEGVRVRFGVGAWLGVRVWFVS